MKFIDKIINHYSKSYVDDFKRGYDNMTKEIDKCRSKKGIDNVIDKYI